jgi:hypothetical protein
MATKVIILVAFLFIKTLHLSACILYYSSILENPAYTQTVFTTRTCSAVLLSTGPPWDSYLSVQVTSNEVDYSSLANRPAVTNGINGINGKNGSDCQLNYMLIYLTIASACCSVVAVVTGIFLCIYVRKIKQETQTVAPEATEQEQTKKQGKRNSVSPFFSN